MIAKAGANCFIILCMLSLCGCVDIDEITMKFHIDENLNVLQEHYIRGFRPSATYGPQNIARTDKEIKQMMSNMYEEFEKDVSSLREEISGKGLCHEEYTIELANATDSRCDIKIHTDSLPITSLMPIYIGKRRFAVEKTESSFSLRIQPLEAKHSRKKTEYKYSLSITYDGTITEHNGNEKETTPQSIHWDHQDLMAKGIYIVLNTISE